MTNVFKLICQISEMADTTHEKRERPTLNKVTDFGNKIMVVLTLIKYI